jgi:alkanesulfonate monooxygenase SsuD/methylene tetrahydromethanopterin reductase-like flavin-dependent oxidoreductase (luciferase family)
MAKVSFPFAVKYGGKFHTHHETLEVAEQEVDKLVALGAKVVGRSPETIKKVPNADSPKPSPKSSPPVKKEK